jgi:UDP-N-acetylmuramoyl-tripeptide--D-alanyl-D-alanine ligase
MDERGRAVLNRDNPMYERLAAAAPGPVLGFGAHPESHARLLSVATDPEGSTVTARIGGTAIEYRLGQPGRHLVMNSLAVMAAVDALGADLGAAAGALAGLAGLAGRGRRVAIAVAGGSATLLDESYNASPASMRAAFAVLAATPPGPGGRRIAVLGDMREMGPKAAELHRGLVGPLVESGVDLVFACGPLMHHLYVGLPAGLRGAWRASAAELAGELALHPGDVVTVKGSLGSRMADIVTPLMAGSPDTTC